MNKRIEGSLTSTMEHDNNLTFTATPVGNNTSTFTLNPKVEKIIAAGSVNFKLGSCNPYSLGHWDCEQDQIVIDELKHKRPNASWEGIDISKTTLHELIHWTGRIDRLNRDWHKLVKSHEKRYPDTWRTRTMSDEDYAKYLEVRRKEEVIAEAGALKMMQRLNLDTCPFLLREIRSYIGRNGGETRSTKILTTKACNYLCDLIGV